jgi:hypothetical protein
MRHAMRNIEVRHRNFDLPNPMLMLLVASFQQVIRLQPELRISYFVAALSTTSDPRWPLKVLHLWPVKLLHPGHRKLMC